MPLQQSDVGLVAFGGEHLNTCGRVTMKCVYKGNAYVDMNLVQCLDVIKNHDTDILDSYSDVFEGL